MTIRLIVMNKAYSHVYKGLFGVYKSILHSDI
jgi:hypothetical protein